MAGRIPQAFIDELLARVDIVSLIESYVPLKAQGKEYAACCPFHQEKTASFTVSPDKQFYHCFGCGAHGTALSFIMEYERLPFPEAVETLASIVGVEIPRDDEASARAESLSPLYDALGSAQKFFQSRLRASEQAIAYLKNRGLIGETAREFGLGFAPDSWDALSTALLPSHSEAVLESAGLVKLRPSQRASDRFRNRITFPIQNKRGRVIGFGGRSLGDGTPKYLNSPDTPLFNKGQHLYGWFQARKAIADAKQVVVVEGYMDVIALAQFGIPNVLATLGTATTAEHVRQLFGAAPEVLFCFDGDRAGRQAAWRAVQVVLPLFRDGKDVRFLFLPQGQDPDSLIRQQGADAFRRAMKSAVSLADYIFAELKTGLDLAQAADRAKLAMLAKPLLDKLSDGVFKSIMHKQLQQEIGVSMIGKQDGYSGRLPERRVSRGPDARKISIGVVGAAIALLIRRPDFRGLMPDISDLETLKQPGMELLIEVLRLLDEDPKISPAAMLERFRGGRYASSVARLIIWEPPGNQEQEGVFKDVVFRLKDRLREQRISLIEAKLRTDGLNIQEMEEYKRLLAKREDSI